MRGASENIIVLLQRISASSTGFNHLKETVCFPLGKPYIQNNSWRRTR